MYMFKCAVLINTYAHISFWLGVKTAAIFCLPYVNCARLKKNGSSCQRHLTWNDGSCRRREDFKSDQIKVSLLKSCLSHTWWLAELVLRGVHRYARCVWGPKRRHKQPLQKQKPFYCVCVCVCARTHMVKWKALLVEEKTVFRNSLSKSSREGVPRQCPKARTQKRGVRGKTLMRRNLRSVRNQLIWVLVPLCRWSRSKDSSWQRPSISWRRADRWQVRGHRWDLGASALYEENQGHSTHRTLHSCKKDS